MGRRRVGENRHQQLPETLRASPRQRCKILNMNLKETATEVVAAAMKAGATAAESVVRDGSEFSTLVRMGEVETLKEAGAKAIGLRVFIGQRSASTYSSDFSRAGLDTPVSSALTLAKITSEDPHWGLPEKTQLGSIPGDLDFFHNGVYSLSSAERFDYARRAEKSALT